MAKISISNVEVLDNPATFRSKFRFKITFECLESLDDDLEWKLIYVSSAYNPDLDQVLDSVLVGPIPVGRHQFILDTDAPDPKKIPTDDVVGVTVVLLEAFYRDQEFVRIGYFVSNDYEKEEHRETPPAEPIIDELRRLIIDSDPRITRFAIKWDNEDEIVDDVTEGAIEDSNENKENENTSVINNSVNTASSSNIDSVDICGNVNKESLSEPIEEAQSEQVTDNTVDGPVAEAMAN